MEKASQYLSPGLPIQRGSVIADCCNRVIRTPLRMVFLGGSLSLYTPAILAAGRRERDGGHVRQSAVTKSAETLGIGNLKLHFFFPLIPKVPVTMTYLKTSNLIGFHFAHFSDFEYAVRKHLNSHTHTHFE